MKELRCGVVGLGRGRKFVEAFDAIDGCKTVAVCDKDANRLADYPRLAAATDYDAFLAEGLDVVAVISPGPVHADQSIRAMDSGAHVLCETPCVYSLEEARDVIAATRRTGRQFMLAEDYPWFAWAQALKARAAEGAFGKIVYAEGDYTHDCRDLMLADESGLVPYKQRHEHPGAKPTWRATNLPPITYCSHTLGPLLDVMNDRVVSVVALSPTGRPATDLAATDIESALMTTAGGSVIRLTNGFTLACPMSLYYSLIGTAGSARVVKDSRLSVRWYSELADESMTGWADMPGDLSRRADGQDHLLAMVRDFIDCVAQGRPAPIDVYRSMDFTLPGLLAHESALAGGTKLDVPDLG